MMVLAAARDVPVSTIAGAWQLRPAPLVFALLAVAAFMPAFARVRREDPAEAAWTRAALYAAGVGLIVVPLCSPLHAAAERYLLSAHMLEHVLLADAGPAVLVVAVRGPIARAMGERLRLLRPVTDVLLRPPVTLAAWAAVIGVWHVPALYDRALRSPTLHDLEHAMFALVGTLVWIQMVDPAGRGRLSLSGRIAFTVAVFFCGQVLSDALVFSFHAYYPAYAGEPGRLLGLSPLADQRLAGLVMSLEQLLTLGTCFALLLRQLRRGGRLQHVVTPG
jgi:cytochrome c oxidase assembly factor CtaG